MAPAHLLPNPFAGSFGGLLHDGQILHGHKTNILQR